jgi:GNAT superfamily N-acetyltransferase
LRRRQGHPIAEPETADLERQQRRMRHLLGTDPAGSWVAETGGRVVGLSQSFVREGYWVLCLLGLQRQQQGQGLGRALLRAAMTHGVGLPGTIQSSIDPSAIALYQSEGFALHPAMLAFGPVRPGAMEPDPRVRPGVAGDLGLTVSVDRVTRGAARPADLNHLLEQPGHRLLVLEDRAYAVVRTAGVVTLGALDADAAAAVLATALADAPAAQDFEVGWLTAPQQWAIDTARRAGLVLRPGGPVMVRGRPAPPAPYLPSGGLG